MDKAAVADLLATASGIYHKQHLNTLDDGLQEAACRKLNSYGMLSLQAIASVVGCNLYRVERGIVGQERPQARGHLNPAHLPWLGYMLSSGKANNGWVKAMYREGTSLSTMEDLTGISRQTFRRKINE